MKKTAESAVAESVKTSNNKDTFLGDKTTNDLESEMTVCIAAICEKGLVAIIVSDCLLTSEGSLLLEFEHNTPKITRLTNNCAAAVAGDLAASTELFELARPKIDGIKNATVSDVGKCIYDAFFELRQKKIEECILRPRGIRDFEEYYERQQQLVRDIVLMIEGQIDEFELELQVLVAGVEENGAHIYCIQDPCDFATYDALGYHAIGIGARHALTSLTVRGYDQDTILAKALMSTYEAKRIAERAPGVGKKTNLAFMTKNITHILTPKQIEDVDKFYQQKVKKISKVEEDWGKALDEITKKVFDEISNGK
jgi:20S proteasome alpha/beta subunit